jgi:hypothetical protein
MLRCGEKGIDVVIVMVTPFPPQARPAVTISANGNEWRFDASIVSPGAELLLPMEAMGVVGGAWRSVHELAVKVSWPQGSVAGVIPIDGMAEALATLGPKCPIRWKRCRNSAIFSTTLRSSPLDSSGPPATFSVKIMHDNAGAIKLLVHKVSLLPSSCRLFLLLQAFGFAL